MKRVKAWYRTTLQWIHRRRRALAWSGLAIMAGLVVVQFLYPPNRTLPWLRVDGVMVGAQPIDRAVDGLAAAYAASDIVIYLRGNNQPHRQVKASAIGMSFDPHQRLASVGYPWYWRLVPTSLLWAHLVVRPTAEAPPLVDRSVLAEYVHNHVRHACQVDPVDASFRLHEGRLVMTPSAPGASCRVEDLDELLATAVPRPDRPAQVTVPITTVPPAVDDGSAQALVARLERTLAGSVPVRAGDRTVSIGGSVILGWLDPVVQDGPNGRGKRLWFRLNQTRADPFLNQQIAPALARPAGVTRVKTRDFSETARSEGQAGQALDGPATLRAVQAWIEAGPGTGPITAVARPVPPRVEYERSYSPTDQGLSAGIRHYVQSHPGSYGVALVELSGQRRRADHQADRQFTTASTYKLFVAYGALRRIESGQWRWSDSVHAGRSLDKCFDDMITVSDNPCAEALLQRIGLRTLTQELHDLGLKKTSFLQGNTPLTTAGDLATFNGMLASGQILSQPSRDRLLAAMKRNVYRQGIPAGTSSPVADKVGFLGGLLHDAAIVYDPRGSYVLAIMSEGSTWGVIAGLTRHLEAIRGH